MVDSQRNADVLVVHQDVDQGLEVGDEGDSSAGADEPARVWWACYEVLSANADPRAAEVLAQAFGRLVRSGSDWGVVAVLDSRLATAGYRNVVLDELPPVRRSVRFADVEAHLAAAPEASVSAA